MIDSIDGLLNSLGINDDPQKSELLREDRFLYL